MLSVTLLNFVMLSVVAPSAYVFCQQSSLLICVEKSVFIKTLKKENFVAFLSRLILSQELPAGKA